MRGRRIKAEGAGYYHCLSRVVDRTMRFGEREKEMFRKMMRKAAEFSGVRILTYCVMSNHFHILTFVPEREELDDKELIRRLGLLYEAEEVREIAEELEALREKKDQKWAERLRNRYLCRMYDVSEFMKTLKQRFSVWYNRNNDRLGTLWEERFKSVLVEGKEHPLLAIATYIDLNPIRGGIVKDPKDYRYSGYAEAVGGSTDAREGLGLVMLSLGADEVWGQVNHVYRRLMYEHGEQVVEVDGRTKKQGFTREQVEKVVETNGKMKMGEILRCKVRYFSDGMVLGSKEYVETILKKHKDQLEVKRAASAREMRWADWNGLCTIRSLRRQVVG
jgi:putative transposase